MNTTLVTRVPKCSSSETTWSTISCGARLRAKPPLPVAQNVHRIGQPTCEETHAVSLFFPFVAGMPTVSTTRLSSRRRRSFATPSVAAATWCTLDRPTVTPSERSDSRATFGRVVRSSTSARGERRRDGLGVAFPRNAGMPRSAANALSSGRVRPSRGNAPEDAASLEEGRERSKVALASSWDSTTRRASRSFHSPSRTPSARGTCVGPSGGAIGASASAAGATTTTRGRWRARERRRGARRERNVASGGERPRRRPRGSTGRRRRGHA